MRRQAGSRYSVELRAKAWQYVLIGGMFAVAGYFVLPNADSQAALYSALGTASVVFVLVGVHLHRPKEVRVIR